MGVRGINLLDGDEVVGMQICTQGDYLLVVSENGMGKRTPMAEFTVQLRVAARVSNAIRLPKRPET